MTDHRENIFEASRSYTSRTFQTTDENGADDAPTDFWDPFDDILEVTHFESTTSDAYRTEFLLAVGGPTVRVVVDSRWSPDVTFHHSWGTTLAGEDCHEISMHPDDAAQWRTLADEYRECQ
jgi:hypothetical protein